MAIEVAGKRFVTLADEFFVNGAKVYEAYANGVKVYPEEDERPPSYVWANTGTFCTDKLSGGGFFTHKIDTSVLCAAAGYYVKWSEQYSYVGLIFTSEEPFTATETSGPYESIGYVTRELQVSERHYKGSVFYSAGIRTSDVSNELFPFELNLPIKRLSTSNMDALVDVEYHMLYDLGPSEYEITD